MAGVSDPHQGWLAVGSVALGTFVMVTSEFLPIGLLSEIADTLDVSRGEAALMVTVPGAVAAVAAPGLLRLTGDIDRRAILVVLTGLIAASNLIVALAGSLGTVLVGRVLLGIGVGGIWAYAPAIGRRLVSPEAGDTAITIILAGISVGTVLGVPIGTTLASVVGWRMVFFGSAGAAALVLGLQMGLLPHLSGNRTPSIRAILSVAAIPMAKLGYAASALTAAGHFAAYTFIEPQLTGAGHLPASCVGLVMGASGIGGVIGTIIGGRAVRHHLRRTFMAATLTMAFAITVVGLSGDQAGLAIMAVVIWGTAFGVVPVCVQTWIYRAAPAAFEAGSALTVTVFQTALALGALGGGVLVDSLGLRSAFMAGGALTLACALLLATRTMAADGSLSMRLSPATKGQP